MAEEGPKPGPEPGPEPSPEPTHLTTVLFKTPSGALKQLDVVQYVERDQVRLTDADIRTLAKEVARVLKEEDQKVMLVKNKCPLCGQTRA